MGFRDALTGLIPGSTAVTVPMLSVAYPARVAVTPGSGCSLFVEYTVDGSGWIAWSSGTATAATSEVLTGAVMAMRFSRTAGVATDSRYTVLPATW